MKHRLVNIDYEDTPYLPSYRKVFGYTGCCSYHECGTGWYYAFPDREHDRCKWAGVACDSWRCDVPDPDSRMYNWQKKWAEKQIRYERMAWRK